MDASQRWETEALRTGSHYRKNPPRPSAKQKTPEAAPHDADANWVTLKEAEAATGIPLNTLRKWSRKSAIPSYLESDGDLTLRMVDLDAVIAHAHELGREVVKQEPDDESTAPPIQEQPEAPEGSLLVPLAAWDKMLNQLGNLHEAGQQLAEARERAVKAETEATFLRERLAEIREESTDKSSQSTVDSEQSEDRDVPLSDRTAEPPTSPDREGQQRDVVPMQGDNAKHPEPAESTTPSDEKETTSYWRYLTFGWRDRKKRTAQN